MENNIGKRLWDPNARMRELRRPAAVANDSTTRSDPCKETHFLNESNSITSTSELAEKSTLSVEAKEWYPPGYKIAAPPENNYTNTRYTIVNNSVQSRLNRYRHTDNDGGLNPNRMRENRAAPDELAYLYEVIKLLTIKPGKFDEVIVTLVDSLAPYLQDMPIVSRITSAIFQQALNEPNFQYSGARLFRVLDESYPVVRACLHSLCEKELETTHNLQKLTLFIAEIYSQLNYELFGNSLLKTLQKMTATPDNVKCICQTLKLIGPKLEALDAQFITDLLKQLDAMRNKLPSSMANLVQSVIKLRDSQWGQTDLIQSAPLVHQPPPADSYEWSDGPVFYGPDGLQLTSEETEFLAENLNDLIYDDTDPDALWNPEPEMNEEIQAAFAEFVRENNR